MFHLVYSIKSEEPTHRLQQFSTVSNLSVINGIRICLHMNYGKTCNYITEVPWDIPTLVFKLNPVMPSV